MALRSDRHARPRCRLESDDWDIYGARINNGIVSGPTPIYEAPGDQINPAVSHDLVVWQSSQQALGTATSNAAELLGKEKELGAVAPGFFADLVAVEGDPLADINVVLNNVRWVMKSGEAVMDKTKASGVR